MKKTSLHWAGIKFKLEFEWKQRNFRMKIKSFADKVVDNNLLASDNLFLK